MTIIPTAAKAVNKIMGKGGLVSATSGANMVKNLAKKLQIPMPVPQNKTGNTSTVEQ